MYAIKVTTPEGTTVNYSDDSFRAWGQAFAVVCFNPSAEKVEVIDEETGKIIHGYKKKPESTKLG